MLKPLNMIDAALDLEYLCDDFIMNHNTDLVRRTNMNDNEKSPGTRFDWPLRAGLLGRIDECSK